MFWKIFRKETVAAELSGVHLRGAGREADLGAFPGHRAP